MPWSVWPYPHRRQKSSMTKLRVRFVFDCMSANRRDLRNETLDTRRGQASQIVGQLPAHIQRDFEAHTAYCAGAWRSWVRGGSPSRSGPAAETVAEWWVARLALAVVSLLLTACATPYQPRGLGPGPTISPTSSAPPGVVAQAIPPTRVRSPVASGTSGPVAWEITAVEQNRGADGRVILWTYDLILRERNGVGIGFQTVVTDSEGARTRTSAYTGPYVRRLEPQGEVRYRDEYWITLAPESAGGFGSIPGGREGVRILKRFEGRDDAGKTVRVDVRFSLDPSVGDPPSTAIDTTPLPAVRSLKSEDLGSLVGAWHGHLLDARRIAFPLEVQIRADGQFDAVVGTVVKQRFPGHFTVASSGELEYGTRTAIGRVTVHGEDRQRVLVGTAQVRPGTGTSSAVLPYSIRVRPTGPAGAVAPSPVTTIPPPAPPPATPPIASTSVPEVLTNESVVDMVNAGLDESVILAKIAATPARFDTRTDALIELKRAAVPDRVLAAMVGKR
jgi:hypothetical protein